jgi:hypothetical protein
MRIVTPKDEVVNVLKIKMISSPPLVLIKKIQTYEMELAFILFTRV